MVYQGKVSLMKWMPVVICDDKLIPGYENIEFVG